MEQTLFLLTSLLRTVTVDTPFPLSSGSVSLRSDTSTELFPESGEVSFGLSISHRKVSTGYNPIHVPGQKPTTYGDPSLRLKPTPSSSPVKGLSRLETVDTRSSSGSSTLWSRTYPYIDCGCHRYCRCIIYQTV